MKVTVEPQPREFIRRQPDEELEGFYKVRVENCRLIVQHVAGEAGPFFRVVFIERRSVVYEMFRQIIALE